MTEARNPFNIRKVETIESDDVFLNLFQPTTIEKLDADTVWDRLQIFRSSQGGGKSSLLRIFTPGPLWQLWKEQFSSQSGRNWGEIYSALKPFSAFSEEGPRILGVLVPCTRPYYMLEQVAEGPAADVRLLNALLDARIVFEAIKAALSLRGLRYPDHASRVAFHASTESERYGQIPFTEGASAVVEWARKTEQAIWRYADEGENAPVEYGHAEIYSLRALGPGSILVDGAPVAERCLVMFDDVHLLAPHQREHLLGDATVGRKKAAIWVAERLQILNAYEVISPGASTGREAVVRNLADQWQSAAQKRPGVFESIASKRMGESSAGVGTRFAAAVDSHIEEAEWLGRLASAHAALVERISPQVADAEMFRDLRVRPGATPQSTYTDAIKLKETEIVVQRNLQRPQGAFDMPEAIDLPSDEEMPKLHAIAEYQMCREYELPYYYGLDKIAQLSSANIDQFLHLGGVIFEALLAIRSRNHTPRVSAKRQEVLIRRAASELWQEIPVRMPQGRVIQRFLTAVGAYCLERSLDPKASYNMFTGFAITSEQHGELVRSSAGHGKPIMAFSDVLALCVAHNLLMMTPKASQGGRTITKFYLNRLLCVHMGLPLGYGGYHVKPVATLAHWARTGSPSDSPNASLDLFSVEESVA